MNNEELRTFLKVNDISQLQFSFIIGVDVKTVGKWCRGENKVPRYCVAYIRVFRELSKFQKMKEIEEHG